MKQGWEIKKLGEVCDIQGGSTPKRTESLYWEGGTYPWFTIEDIREQGRIITDTKQKVTKVAWDKLRVFPKDTVLLCCTASIGEYAITHIPLTSNQQFNGLMIKDKTYLSPMYLMHYCATLKEKLSSLSGKATIDFVSAEKVRQITIPVPPREEQERIVAELDCLSGIIEKKKQQLKELDALAESIFYSMFGDDVGKLNKWESCSIGDIYKFQYGKGNKIPESKGEYPCYGSNGQVGFHTEFNAEDSPIIGHIGAYAGIVIWASGKHYVTYNGVICKLKHNGFNPIYGFYLLKAQNYMDSARGGVAQPFVSYDMLEAPLVYIPPLVLQQEFADKIEAIEKQKALIKQSITQTETLFNARMDYYFN